MLSLAAGLSATALFLQFGAVDGLQAVDFLRALLILASTLWLAWGAIGGVIGLLPRFIAGAPPVPIEGRTVVLVPVYNEDPVVTFARVAAMLRSVDRDAPDAHIDFAILSDTRDADVARREAFWFGRLVHDTGGEGRLFYRRRPQNAGKKAGNIEDFIRTSGAAWDYALILDADSLMEGATIAQMIRRMEAAPQLGLLQSLPKVVCARSRFGRAMQFSASFYSPVFARGLAHMQGLTGPFWGHNALVRVRAFAECCGLPQLSGTPPFGGHVLSHDYVEAALLARGGWEVRLDEDLGGSYEEGPENIIDHAKRDRRWCQGNLQHARLLGAPKLRAWSRFVFLQGIIAYIAPLFWGGFLIASIFDATSQHQPDYFPEPYQLFPVFPSDQTTKAIGLAIGIFGLLVAPKLLIVLEAALSGRARGFGGVGGSLMSMLCELVLSSMIAPLMLMYQGRSVIQVLLGRDSGWPPNNRGDGRLTVTEALAASKFIVVTGALGLAATWYYATSLVPWMLPVALPMILAPAVISWTSRPSRSGAIFAVPAEAQVPAILATHAAVVAIWSARDETGPLAATGGVYA